VCWTIWKTRNDACFNIKFPNDPTNTIYGAISLTTCRSRKTEKLERGAEQLKKVAREVYSRVHGWAPTTLRIAEWLL
jgi:hypothetical protein